MPKNLKLGMKMFGINLKVKKPLSYVKNYELSLKGECDLKEIGFLFEILKE
jgi:hypothetical protein